LDELLSEFGISQGKAYHEINFLYLQLLIRALSNIALLEKDQVSLVKRIRDMKIIKRIMDLLNKADSEILKV